MKLNLIKIYAVPILALLVILVHVIYVNTFNLTKWKGGGFGMYSEVHYYYNDIYINNLNPSLDSLETKNVTIANAIMNAKRIPSEANLKKMAELVSKYSSSDTIRVQVWKPWIDAKNETYSRELVNQFKFIKP